MEEEHITYADCWRFKAYAPTIYERVDRGHIKDTFQARIE